jgi:pimeloyl-ACP methyl ester carboxylesterase
MSAVREGVMVLPEGRRVGWLEEGTPDGSPVFVFHGLPGSRFQRHPDASIALEAGARVIHPERPGFGLSTPVANRRLLDWPGDVAACADALGIGRFAIAGISGGGPYALACAHALGERVTRTAVIGGVGPPGSMPHGMLPLVKLGFALAPHAPALVRAAAWPLAQLAVTAPERHLQMVAAQMAPADRPILAREAVRAMFAADYAAAFAQGVDALARDLALVAAPWGFSPAPVPGPVAFWHGTDDRMVPASASRVLASAMGAPLLDCPGEGHFMVFDRWRGILDWLVRGPSAPAQG